MWRHPLEMNFASAGTKVVGWVIARAAWGRQNNDRRLLPLDSLSSHLHYHQKCLPKERARRERREATTTSTGAFVVAESGHWWLLPICAFVTRNAMINVLTSQGREGEGVRVQPRHPGQ